MSLILCAQFDDFERAQLVANDLELQGVRADDIQQFALNAPGQHDCYPIGGDEDADRGAREGGDGAAAGAALGSVAGIAVGAAALPVLGPLAALAGAGVGAYVGSFAGAVNKLGNDEDALTVAETPRPAGVRVAVRVDPTQRREGVVAAFSRHHAKSIEEADGAWRDGMWADFDPVAKVRWIQPPAN